MVFNKDTVCKLTAKQVRQRAQNLLNKLTLKEKVWLLNGNWDLLHNQIRHANPYNPLPISTNGCERLGISPMPLPSAAPPEQFVTTFNWGQISPYHNP